MENLRDIEFTLTKDSEVQDWWEEVIEPIIEKIESLNKNDRDLESKKQTLYSDLFHQLRHGQKLFNVFFPTQQRFNHEQWRDFWGRSLPAVSIVLGEELYPFSWAKEAGLMPAPPWFGFGGIGLYIDWTHDKKQILEEVDDILTILQKYHLTKKERRRSAADRRKHNIVKTVFLDHYKNGKSMYDAADATADELKETHGINITADAIIRRHLPEIKRRSGAKKLRELKGWVWRGRLTKE